MTEQLGESIEPNEPNVSMRFEVEAAPQDFLQRLVREGIIFSQQTFPDREQALAAGRQFVDTWQGQGNECPYVDSVIMRAEGNRLFVSSTKYEEEADGSITIRRSAGDPVEPLPLMSSRLFQYRGVYTSVAEHPEEADFFVSPFILGHDLIASRQAHNTQLGFALDSSFYQSKVLVPCARDVAVESVRLRQERLRTEAMENLAVFAQDYPDLLNDLARIDQEMFETKGRRRELQHIHALRSLGRTGIEFSALSSKHEDALNTAIATTFGEGKALHINANVYSLDAASELTQHNVRSFEAKLINVIANAPMANENKGQTLAVAPMRQSDGEGMYYVPLTEIKSIHF